MSMMTIEGVDFEVTVRAGDNLYGEVPNVGHCAQDEDGDRIWIEGRCSPNRRDEILLHEIIHLVAPHMEEPEVLALSSRLFGVLNGNGLWRSPDLDNEPVSVTTWTADTNDMDLDQPRLNPI